MLCYIETIAFWPWTPPTLHPMSMSHPHGLQRHLRLPQLVSRLLIIALSAAAAGCTGSGSVAPEVQAIIDQLESAEVPARYQMSYVPISDSPYLACLGGVDVVDMTVDHETEVIRYQPQRNTPAIVATNQTLFIVDASAGELQQASLIPPPDPSDLRDVFGDSLAVYLSDGLRTPDLNALTLASISVAESARVESSSSEAGVHELVITLDTDAFNERFSADAEGPIESEDAPAPLTVEALVNASGLTTRFVVSSTAQESHGNYALTARYDSIERVEVPAHSSIASVTIRELSFPRPQDSCEFEQ